MMILATSDDATITQESDVATSVNVFCSSCALFLKINNILTYIYAVFVKTIYQRFAQQDEINNNCGNVEEEANYAPAPVAQKSNKGSLGVKFYWFCPSCFSR